MPCLVCRSRKAHGASLDCSRTRCALPTLRPLPYPQVDPTLWKIELERVAPKLRITIAADSKDWRSHLDEAHQHKEVRRKRGSDGPGVGLN